MTSVWYPYTQMENLSPFLTVSSGDGVHIVLDDGRRLIDAISSWWCVIHGYNHPELNQAAIDQLNKMSHVMLGGLTHDAVEKLADKLVSITPDGLNHVFFSDSGSVGVEVAMKMAVQYWMNLGKGEKCKFLALKKSYHGDTTGVMALCDPEEGMHHLYHHLLQKHYFIEAPEMGYDPHPEQLVFDCEALEDFLKNHHHELAAFIVEPLLQGAGGFNMYAPEYLQKARALCDDYGVLLIFDEVATGFGRTGSLFASDQCGICPDIMILGKGLTGGYIGMAATLATSKIFSTFFGDDSKCFMHGPTFSGNPLACSIALKSIEIFERDGYLDKIKGIERILKRHLLGLSSPKVKDVRVLGATGVIEVNDPSLLDGFQDFAVDNGIWLRPFGAYLYTMPPYVISDGELEHVLSVMIDWVMKKV